MKRDPKLFEKTISKIKSNIWYRQRFDACPHLMFFLGDAHTSEIQHTQYKFGQSIAYTGFSKNRADWYHSFSDLNNTAQHIIKEAENNSYISQEMILAFKPWQEQFYACCKKIKNANLSLLSNADLLKLYNKLSNIYTKKLNASPLIDGFALSTDEHIFNEVKKFLLKKGLEDKFVEYLEVITAPVFLSFLQEEELELLHIALFMQKDPSQKDILLKKHQEQYFWIQNNYVKDNVLGVSYFEDRIKSWTNFEYKKRINEIENLSLKNIERKKKLLRQLKLPNTLKLLLQITDDFNAWQDERKKGTFWATHYFSILFEEFSKRTGYTVEELKYCFPPEMQAVLNKEISQEELKARFDYCMLLWTLDTYDVTTDKSLINILDKIGTGEYVNVKELMGFSAQLGKVCGRIVIVESVEEIYKVKEGDVLVAVMTRPDYLPAMKKAAAFITDEGGITCHAAITAREMKKPCVVGTKIATKIFKDGDVVEVDADNGVIRKIR